MPPGRGLGIKQGEHWAYRPKPSLPLEQVVVVHPGDWYDSPIAVRRLEHDDEIVTCRRAKLPCKWERVEEYLDHYRRRREEREAALEADLGHKPVSQAAVDEEYLREVTMPLPAQPISYNVMGAARATGLSDSRIRQAIKDGELRARYPGASRMVIEYMELWRWIRHLPNSAEPR